ncbi:MAG: ATP-binding protein [Paraglaciecola sp.]|uniref:ATP-binding protein n=1 Tax=Paraglaciecola sp. TaxID=1920173 RepID=UPI00273DD01D|nr:ATP-binding protein [Paraglaciecola sp.]MDP5032608.1 ATP-binding protein [Paraglaciecola sp.]MDP5134025.1 ATP-binding protein [Paraglaciecola sp.]
MSIRRYLTLILISVITLVTFASAIQGYRSSMLKAASVFDDELKSLALILASTSLHSSSKIDLDQSAFTFQIWQDNHVLVSSNQQLTSAIGNFSEGFGENNFLAQRWRTYSHWLAEQNQWIIVAQPLSYRFELAENVILAAVTPLVISIAILAALTFLIISRGLLPLNLLSEALKIKKADDLRPLSAIPQAAELVPVVNTLNQLFERLESAFVREKRFASDAAHELRTPLSVLKINAHNLAIELQAQQQPMTNMTFLQQGIERMSHVVEQILLLNRTNPEQYRGKFVRLDLTTLCQNVIATVYPQIAQKQQEIELLGECGHVVGDEFALEILLQNLISNASKYTPDFGQIRVTLRQLKGEIVVNVEDSGPGMAPSEYALVFERFYRIGGDRHASNVPGCGLGLAIAKHIAQLHHATLSLSHSETLGGLAVDLRFSQKGAELV